MIRWCFTHNERTAHLLTCIAAGFRHSGPCDVGYGEVIRCNEEEATT